MRIQALFAFGALVAGIGLTAAGCGSPGSATVIGTIDDKPLAAVEAVSFDVDEGGFGAGIVIISSTGGTCDLFTAGSVHKNLRMLQIGLAELDLLAGKTVPPTGSGEFAIINPNGGGSSGFSTLASFVTFFALDDKCFPTGEPIFAKSGTVTVDSAGDGEYAGSGDVVLDNGDHITFEFDSLSCGKVGSLDALSKLQGTCK